MPTNEYGKLFATPECVAFESRKSDTLGTLVFAALSMEPRRSSSDHQEIDRGIADIQRDMPHYVKDIGGMVPILRQGTMEDSPVRKSSTRPQPRRLDNITRIVPFSPIVLGQPGLIRLVTQTDFPIYEYVSATNNKENICPRPTFALFPTRWNRCVYQAFADQEARVMFRRLDNWSTVDCSLPRMGLQTRLNLIRADQTNS
jgi:hypothetical protein